MNKFLMFLLITFPAVCYAHSQRIQNGASVYIEPMDGYEAYLAAAFTKKHVPLIVVADRDKAEYVITSTVAHKDLSAEQPVVVLEGTTASIAVIDLRASQIVYAYAGGTMGTNQLQKTAEDCANHLKKLIEKARD